MAGLDELKQRMLRARNEIARAAIDTASVMALSAKALIDRGLKEKGIPGETYSESPLPLFFLTGNAKTKYGKEAIKKLSKDRRKAAGDSAGKSSLVTYPDLRQVEGLQTGHVDLTFTGKTLQALGIVDTRETVSGKYVALLGGTNQEAKDKIGYAFAHYGRWMEAVLGQQDGKALLRQIAIDEYKRLIEDRKILPTANG